jgi:hypothetical protein
LDNFEIRSLLQSLGERVPPGSQLILIGGGALALLGSPRLTVDIDFVGDDIHPSEFHRSIMQIARELKIDAEPVPLDRFVPLPMGSTERQIHIGQFGNLEIYVADPYSIALSKLDRGFDTDFDIALSHPEIIGYTLSVRPSDLPPRLTISDCLDGSGMLPPCARYH